MERIKLPNIRKLFIPDPGMLICDADLSGADAQVVAWEAEDEDLKAAFRAGLDVHAKNAADLFGSRFTNLEPKSPMWKKLRQQCKHAVHGTNYGGSPRALNQHPGIAWPVAECARFQARWFELHPGIKRWHQRVEGELQTRRSVVNRFGFRHTFFDRPDSVFPEALAYVPQSTVAIVCFKGALAVEAAHPWVEFLIQVHDSLVFQIPLSRRDELPSVLRTLHVPIPYNDPLTISWSIKTSEKSWGDCE